MKNIIAILNQLDGKPLEEQVAMIESLKLEDRTLYKVIVAGGFLDTIGGCNAVYEKFGSRVMDPKYKELLDKVIAAQQGICRYSRNEHKCPIEF